MFRADQAGSVSFVMAGWLVVVAGIGALAFDYGRMAIDKRKAQAATNQAAVAAASNLMAAESMATAAVSSSSVNEQTETIVVRGRYSHDPMLPREQRFKPDPVNANAARVTVRTETPLHVGRVLSGAPSYAITTEATATSTAFGAIAIGNRTLSLQPQLLNQLLSSLLGGRIELGAADYSALATARIDLFQFLSALATETRLTSATYDRVARQSVQVTDALEALARAARNEGGETAASQVLDQIADAASRNSESFRASALFSPGPYAGHMVGENPGGQAITVTALDLLNALAQIASGRRQAEASIDLQSPGISGATIKLAFGERPSSLSWIKIGHDGVSTQSPQTRVMIKLRLRGAGAIHALDLPLTVEVGNATAQISSVSCNYMQPALSVMNVDAKPGTVDAWIGDISDFEFANLAAVARPYMARIVDVSGLRVTGRASASMQGMYPNTLVFTQGDANARLTKSVGGRDVTMTLMTRLLQSAQFAVEKRDVSEAIPPTPTKVVAEMLGAALPAIERTLAHTLDTIGVGVGRVDVTPLGIRCDSAILVQ